MEMIKIEGVSLEGYYGITERRDDFLTFLEKVNGCGSGAAWIDFVPDYILGLSITPVCNLHDDAWTFCPATREYFDISNSEFNSNLKVWIKAKSNFITVGPRLGIAYLYYIAVDKKGWGAFCKCKEALGEDVRDG